jgi:hypothetical protein
VYSHFSVSSRNQIFTGKQIIFKYADIIKFVAVQYTAFEQALFYLSDVLWVMLVAPMGFM